MSGDGKPSAAFLGDLASRLAAGPPKKPVGLLKKPAASAETDPDAHIPPATGGIGQLAGAMAAAAAARAASKGDASEKPADS